MAFVRIDGVLLHYRLAGPKNGPGLVLVNSLGTDARIWDDVIALMAAQYRILSYDKRGHGLSDSPDGDYSLEDHLNDLTGLIDHVGMGEVAVMGVSVGGLIAQGFALAHPERLTALVLCDTAPKLGDAAAWTDRIAAVREFGMEAISQSVMERWFSADLFKKAPDTLAGWRNQFIRTDPDGYCRTCATLRDTDLSGVVGDISAPTLVVCGAEDLSTPPDLVRARQVPFQRRASSSSPVPATSHPSNSRTSWQKSSRGSSRRPAMADTSKYESGMAVRRAVLGDGHVDETTARITDLDVDFQTFITETAWGVGLVPARTDASRALAVDAGHARRARS